MLNFSVPAVSVNVGRDGRPPWEVREPQGQRDEGDHRKGGFGGLPQEHQADGGKVREKSQQIKCKIEGDSRDGPTHFAEGDEKHELQNSQQQKA